jgi:hypothetical protein
MKNTALVRADKPKSGLSSRETPTARMMMHVYASGCLTIGSERARRAHATPPAVMRGLVPRIHVLLSLSPLKTWMAGMKPAMTVVETSQPLPQARQQLDAGIAVGRLHAGLALEVAHGFHRLHADTAVAAGGVEAQ